MTTQRPHSSPRITGQATTGQVTTGQATTGQAPAPAPAPAHPECVPLPLIGALVGRIAHDLNNVLTPIVGNTELALLSLGEDHPARPDVEQAHAVALETGRLLSRRLASLALAIENPALGDPNDAFAAFGIELGAGPATADRPGRPPRAPDR